MLPQFYSGATGQTGRFSEGFLLRRLHECWLQKYFHETHLLKRCGWPRRRQRAYCTDKAETRRAGARQLVRLVDALRVRPEQRPQLEFLDDPPDFVGAV